LHTEAQLVATIRAPVAEPLASATRFLLVTLERLVAKHRLDFVVEGDAGAGSGNEALTARVSQRLDVLVAELYNRLQSLVVDKDGPVTKKK
jgi:hypothetical protein